MNAARPAKRRRLDVEDNHHNQAEQPVYPSTQSYLHPAAYHKPPIKLEAYNVGNKATPANRAQLLPSTSRPTSRNSMNSIEQGQLECCYGMLCDIPAKPTLEVNPNSTNIPVEFHGPNRVSSTLDGLAAAFDIICPISAQILGELDNVVDIKTQLYCHSKLNFDLEGNNRRNGRRREKSIRLWFLNIIIFGREDIGEKLGQHLSKRKRFLQDPLGCHRSIPYRNPHAMTVESDEIVMSDSFDSALGNLEIERLEAGPDLLAQLMKDDVPLPETEAPSIITTPLFRHQKQALTFMIRRERGWSLDDGTRDIWSRRKDPYGRFSYTNNVGRYDTDDAPADFRGGLLADDMGLGKTLSMICLIATNQLNLALSFPGTVSAAITRTPSAVLKTTLLIVPPALIQAWEKQFLLHVQPGKLKCHIYHGQNRKDTESLGQYDIVITTYHTVSAIWRKRIMLPRNEQSIFSLTWHRVILDEAHTIQNPQSQLAQACCQIHSTRRWAITGTPIQNKLIDFASIVRFLRVHPYSDPKIFDEEIMRPWQNRHSTDAQGFLRLKALVRAITISRTKAVVQLPPRVDEVHHLNFSPAERERYDAAKSQSKVLLEDAIASQNQGSKTFNALWLLNTLRLICNHGLLAKSAVERDISQTPQASRDSWFQGQGFETFYGNVLGGNASCSNCGANLLDDILEGSVSTDIETQRHVIPPGQVICNGCHSQIGHNRINTSFSSNLESPDSAGSSAPTTPRIDDNVATIIDNMSTKIKALVADLCKHSDNEKSVVFSYWTSTLDFVQLMLDDKGIAYTRIDGKTPLPKRNEALGTFQRDDSVRIILVSITCGGAGLDLTAGSRAYLLEPHWNPMIEEQALCRVHRVGQQRRVTTIRYLMRDSFEEQIVEIQKRKKMLAQVTFASGPLSEAGIGLGTLQYLRSVL